MIKVSDWNVEIQGEYWEVMGELTELIKGIRKKYDYVSDKDFQKAIEISKMNNSELVNFAIEDLLHELRDILKEMEGEK
jgi:hypothetical protein